RFHDANLDHVRTLPMRTLPCPPQRSDAALGLGPGLQNTMLANVSTLPIRGFLHGRREPDPHRLGFVRIRSSTQPRQAWRPLVSTRRGWGVSGVRIVQVAPISRIARKSRGA